MAFVSDSARPRAQQREHLHGLPGQVTPHWNLAAAGGGRCPSVLRCVLGVVAVSFLLTFAGLTGCSSNKYRTHNGNLIDDKVTTQRVQAALKAAGADFKNIQVQTTDSEVTLTGAVKSPEIQTRAEEIAKGVHRVSKVDDKLQVRQ